MASLLFHSLFDFNLHIPANALLFTAVAGMTFSTAACIEGKASGEELEEFDELDEDFLD